MSCNNCNSCDCEQKDVPDVQEFVLDKEYTIGEFFKFGERVYKVVTASKDCNCPLCDLGMCEILKCTACERSDGREIEAILYDSEERNVR